MTRGIGACNLKSILFLLRLGGVLAAEWGCNLQAARRFHSNEVLISSPAAVHTCRYAPTGWCASVRHVPPCCESVNMCLRNYMQTKSSMRLVMLNHMEIKTSTKYLRFFTPNIGKSCEVRVHWVGINWLCK